MSTAFSNYMAALADYIERQRAKATHPNTRDRDAHDILTAIGGADFALRLARDFYESEQHEGKNDDGK